MNHLSTVIVTFNEEAKIERCIRSALAVSDEVVVLDSFSTDKTTSIAESLGAKVFSQEFKGYIQQRFDSVALASHDLILTLDGDEYLSEELIAEIKLKKETRDADGYFMNRLSSIAGHWIRHGTWHPDYILRLFYKDKVTIGGEAPHVKNIPHGSATIKKLSGILYHEAHESIEDRIASVEKHSTSAAQSKFAKGKSSSTPKKYLKTVWKLFSEYVLRLGFLDGYYGWVAAKTTAQYVFLREQKLQDLSRKK